MNTPQTANIHTALAAIMATVGYVQKSAAKGLKFTITTEADFLQAVRPHFLNHGIVMHPIHVETARTDILATSSGTNMNYCQLIVTYRMTHAQSGTYIDIMTTGSGWDHTDKAPAKAMTAALKYALRQTLLIETGDDPDPEKLRKEFHALGSQIWGTGWSNPNGDNMHAREKLVRLVTNNRAASSTDLTYDELQDAVARMRNKVNANGAR